jgi:polyphosphate kinase
VAGAWQFRVTRNSDLFVDDEEVDNLLRAIEGELAERRYGAAVRLETSMDCPENITEFLLRHFALSRDDLYQVRGPVNLNRLMAIYDLIDRPDLKYPSFTPSIPKRLVGREDLLTVIREGDLLLHHPYEAFGPVIDLLRQSANDPHVLAIKQTLYRTGAQSPIVDSLVAAARAGKEVTVVIELMARFDEAANIELATRLQEAGAHVMYGVVGYKTHAKLIMVVRREGDHLRRYCHLGTGNYHPNTARVYTDYGLFTCNEAIGEDIHELFLQLTSPTRAATMQKILQSPFTLHDSLLEKTRREMEIARSGRAARIVVKLNALLEPLIIQALYQASMAGVCVELIVRGMCSLRPGVRGLSENIKVRSVVGRFLEHSRVYYFLNDGNPEVYCASADWMERNFFRRIEVAFPIEEKVHRDRMINELELYLADNEQAWTLCADGTYQRPHLRSGGVNAQRALLRRYSEGLD